MDPADFHASGSRASTWLSRTRPALIALAAVSVVVLMGDPAGATGPAAAVPGTISTIIGGPGGPGPATAIAMTPWGVSFHLGSLYVADSSVVREVAGSDHETVLVGTGWPSGPRLAGQPAITADVAPYGVAWDHRGNLVLTDDGHYEIAVVAAHTGRYYGQAMTAGHIYRVAGDGRQGETTSGVAATGTALGDPYAVAVDASGNLVLADSGFLSGPRGGVRHGSEIDVVAARTGTFYGQAMTAGHIYTIAGTPEPGVTGVGGLASQTGLGLTIQDVFPDQTGNLVFADASASQVRVVAAVTGTFYGQAMTAGHIYAIAGTGQRGFSGDGGPATQAELANPRGVTLDRERNVVVADTSNSRIRVVAAVTGTFYGQAMTAGDIYTIAGTGQCRYSGNGGPAGQASLCGPVGVTVGTTGNLAIADTYDSRVRLVPSVTGTFYGQAMTAGHMYTIGGTGAIGDSGDGGPATAAELAGPDGVTVDRSGDVLVADHFNTNVRMVPSKSGTFYGQPMKAGNIYRIAGTGKSGFSGDGGPATKAKLNNPVGVATDKAGNLLIADTFNSRIRVVAAHTGRYYGQAMKAGYIYSVAGGGTSGLGDGGPATKAKLGEPNDVAVDAAGNLVIPDADYNRIRVVAVHTGRYYGQAMKAGYIYSVAGNGNNGYAGDGGPATQAEFSGPQGVAVDAAGNLLISDTFNNRIRVVAVHTGRYYGQAMKAGYIYSVAGNGNNGYAGDGGPATDAEFSNQYMVRVDHAGNLVIADWQNGRVRVVAVSDGTFYGITMTAGDVYTVAGNGKSGFAGDGGPATSARLTNPQGIAVNGAGDLLIGEFTGRVRMVAG